MLTKRQQQVLELISLGGTQKAVANELGISVKTVEAHVTRAWRKLNAKTAAHAVAIGYEKGLLP